MNNIMTTKFSIKVHELKKHILIINKNDIEIGRFICLPSPVGFVNLYGDPERKAFSNFERMILEIDKLGKLELNMSDIVAAFDAGIIEQERRNIEDK